MIAVADNLLLSGKFSSLTLYMSDFTNDFYRGINEGRMTAREVDLYLEGSSNLPVTGGIVKRTAGEVLRPHPGQIQKTALKG